MLQNVIAKLFGPKKAFVPPNEAAEAKTTDPLDPRVRTKPWAEQAQPTDYIASLRKVSDFPVDDSLPGESKAAVGDAALATGKATMDDGNGDDQIVLKSGWGFGGGQLAVPAALNSWYMSQSFIGYQACAIIAQHWLVDKACSMAGEDAARNGWVISSAGARDSTDELPKADHDAILEADKQIKIKENLVEFNRFKNIFGIRIAIFKVNSDDPLYYEKPFNIDGITKGSYVGISQVDPYWMTPTLRSDGANDPSSIGFYEPEFWVINGKKYHISHLAIARGPMPADILKPMYIFGGIPLTQRIYERVYAAERTANEAPLMAMSKRTTTIHADLDKIVANQDAFEQRLQTWVTFRDNHGVKVLGLEEAMEQFDTSMTDFDSIIMNQYQIVAAIARTPATKLLGTSPKGFNATGEFESKSYHEELESIEEHVMMPMLERHYAILSRSLGLNIELNVVFNPVDSVNAEERAALNKQKSDTGVALINAGVISPDEERERIMDDEHSGYNRLEENGSAGAETQAGMSPENLAALQKAGAAETKAGASEQAVQTGQPMPPGAGGGETDTAGAGTGGANAALQALVPALLAGVAQRGKDTDPAMAALLLIASQMLNKPAPTDSVEQPRARSVKPSVLGSTKGSTTRGINIQDAEIVRAMPKNRMPKMRLNGLNLFIENPRGTMRTGTHLDGTEWANEMPDHYGFIHGYEGADGDEVDCFIGPNLRAGDVHIITQNSPDTGQFDEYKCMIGYDTPEGAEEAYHASYGDDWEGYGGMQSMSFDDFKDWLESGAGAMAMDEFKEADHPRAKNGQFGSGGGGASAPAPAPASGGSATLKPAGSSRESWPEHIKALKLPPAWTDVRVSSDPNASLLAVGKDAKGRPQYVYSQKFVAMKAAEKFERVKAMNDQIGGIKAKIAKDAKSDDPKVRATADAMSVVVGMGIRPGSDVDTKAETKAYGASNLEGRHVTEKDGKTHLEFTGKKGVALSLPVNDPKLASMLKDRSGAAGADGRLFPGVTDKGLLEYSHSLGGGDFKTKDFRTYNGTSTAMETINSMPVPKTQKEFQTAVKAVGKRVSEVLGNTPVIALQSYIDPSVFSAWKAALE